MAIGQRTGAVTPGFDYLFADPEALSDSLSAQKLFRLLDDLLSCEPFCRHERQFTARGIHRTR